MKVANIGFSTLPEPLCGYCGRTYDDPSVYTHPIHHHDNLTQEMVMPEITKEELRNKLLKIRDEVLEFNPLFMAMCQMQILPDNNEGELYDVYLQLHSTVTKMPYNNPIAKILEKKQ